MLKTRLLIVFLVVAVTACSGGNSDGQTESDSVADSLVEVTEAPTTTEAIEPMSYSDAVKNAYGVEMLVDANDLSTSLFAAGLLPMIGPQGSSAIIQREELCKGLPLSVHMPLASGDSIQVASYESVGYDESLVPDGDEYAQSVTISLISGLTEADYQNDITKIRAALTEELRCETERFNDGVRFPILEDSFDGNLSYDLGVETGGSDSWKLMRFFGFPAEDLVCTTKTDSLGLSVATTQVRMGTLADDDEIQLGITMLIYFMPVYELGVVVNAEVRTGQWYGRSGDSEIAFNKSLELANEFGSKTVTGICASAMAYKQAYDEKGYSQFSPTALP